MAIVENELNLTDLIDIATLQKIQDAFSLMTGMAALTTDRNGIAVTKGSNFSDFCMKYTRPSGIGGRRCEQCDKIGAEMAQKEGVSYAYFCHAGLVDFAAPIMAGNQMIGCFIGGQVLTQEPDKEKMRRVAEEIGVDPDEYIEAAGKVRIVGKKTIDKATASLYVMANVLSEIAYSKHQMYLNNIELEKSSHMKSDFLANVSHEIRTPMNAVIGMAEMTLREELSPAARDYVRQIKSSGQTLLAIINDILDFSKIESGKMDIIEVDYEPMSVINDMVNIIMTRIGNKDLELTMDVNPNLPHELHGDNIRIKQIMVNLANNAVKFTQRGCVHLKVDFVQTDDKNVELQISVSDTGAGIKEEDINKLFVSFQQVDSKRNRNIEGTGLGLAICKQLVSLMHGKIHVDSVYGEGSTFTFVIPQKVVRREPSVNKVREKAVAAGLIQSVFVAEQIEIDMPRQGIEYFRLDSAKNLFDMKARGAKYLFVEQSLFDDAVQNFLRANQDIIGVVLVNFRAMRQYDIPNVRVVKKPLYSLNLAGVLNGDDVDAGFSQIETDDFDFIAPEAEILIVDDNDINLTVVRGLLEPLSMKIDTVLSGKEAVSKIMDKRYDIVFMDHMMPEMDGVETTRVIRRLLGENGQIPIIALTANAVEGTRDMFISEGMNDFVAKPIELKVMTAKLKKWLPEEKILKQTSKKKDGAQAAAKREDEHKEISIGGLDVQTAMKLLGNEKLFWSVLKEYYRVIDKKYTLIREYERKEKWKEYTIEVHALKSASRQIGAMELAKVAERMEAAGNAREVSLIHEMTPGMLDQYLRYKGILAPYFTKEASEHGGAQIDKKDLAKAFEEMRAAMDDLDMDAMEEVVKKLSQYSYSGWQQEYFDRLKDAVEDIDTEKCEEILEEWEMKL